MNPQQNSSDQDEQSYLIPSSKLKTVLAPMSDEDKQRHGHPSSPDANPAAEVIRRKLEALYEHEPNAKQEAKEAEAAQPRSKHQQFMHRLTNSGKSLAEIQVAWHNYYSNLPDDEKHQVWQEFYSAHARASQYPQAPSVSSASAAPAEHSPHHQTARHSQRYRKPQSPTKNTVRELKNQLFGRIDSQRQLQAKHHVQSVIFGLALGSVVLLILLFGFFNERFIAPFITPSRSVSSTQIITDPNNAAVGSESKVIIPKINVEVPVVYGLGTIEENAIQDGLESGVVHYATTPNPGEQGNSVIVGHSSNNILNRGKYKFAFVLLNRLENGDTFYLEKGGIRYVYKIYEKKIVKPTDVSVLNPIADKAGTATLITCDPPGTSTNRLIVVGEQISPSPSTNIASSAIKTDIAPTTVPGNAPSLWQRMTGWL